MAATPNPRARAWRDVAERLAARADALARAYAARAPEASELYEAGLWLGAVSAARAARALAGRRSFADRFVDGVGRHVTVAAPEHDGHRAAGAFVDHDAPSSLAVVALAAIAKGEPATIALGPKSARVLEPVADALSPLSDLVTFQADASAIDAGAPRLSSADRGLSLGAATFGDRPAALFVAPYYYDRADLRRMIRGAALEAIAPALPASELVLLLPTGWDQARAFEDGVRAEVERAPAAERLRVTTRTLDAMRPLDTLAAATDAARSLAPHALGAFVHPLWRERPEIAASMRAFEEASGAKAIAIHHGPSLAWRVGAADLVRGATVRVEAPVGLAPIPARFRLRARGRHESTPGVLSALAHAAFARLGL